MEFPQTDPQFSSGIHLPNFAKHHEEFQKTEISQALRISRPCPNSQRNWGTFGIENSAGLALVPRPKPRLPGLCSVSSRAMRRYSRRTWSCTFGAVAGRRRSESCWTNGVMEFLMMTSSIEWLCCINCIRELGWETGCWLQIVFSDLWLHHITSTCMVVLFLFRCIHPINAHPCTFTHYWWYIQKCHAQIDVSKCGKPFFRRWGLVLRRLLSEESSINIETVDIVHQQIYW